RERPGGGELADLSVDGDLAAPPRHELACEPGRQRGQVAIALGDAEQPVQPVAGGRHGPRPPSLRAEVVEVGVDGDADRAIVGLVSERVDVSLGGLSRRMDHRVAVYDPKELPKLPADVDTRRAAEALQPLRVALASVADRAI